MAHLLDVISLIKSKHTILNKRSSSLKPRSVTFKEEIEKEETLFQDKKIFKTMNGKKDKHQKTDSYGQNKGGKT